MSPVVQSGTRSSDRVASEIRKLKSCRGREFLYLPVFFSLGGSATSSPAMLGIRRHSKNYQRAQSSMQLDTYYGDNSLHKQQYTGSCCGVPQGFMFGPLAFLSNRWFRNISHLFLSSSVCAVEFFHFRVWEENSIFHWDIFFPVRRGFEKIPGETCFKFSTLCVHYLRFFQQKKQKNHWFQPLRCQYLLTFFIFLSCLF